MPPDKGDVSGTVMAAAKNWPDRNVPSVKDIVAYRKTLPINTPPKEIGRIAGLRFGWKNNRTVTTEQYIQGVVAGHDHATRAIIDELRGYMPQRPASPEEAMQLYQWLTQWLDEKPRPSLPNQNFED